MTPPINIDGTDITGASIDGSDVTAVTVDGTEVFSAGLPDSGNLHARYDASELSGLSDGDIVDPWTDRLGTADMIVGDGTPTYKTNVKNGKAVVRYSPDSDLSNGDWHEVGTDDFGTLTSPYTIYHVQAISDDNLRAFISGDGSTEYFVRTEGSPEFRIVVPSTNTDFSKSTASSSWLISSYMIAGGDSEFRETGSQAQTFSSSEDLSGFTVGRDAFADEDYYDGDIGEIVVYNTDHDDTTQSEVETFLADKWGITL